MDQQVDDRIADLQTPVDDPGGAATSDLIESSPRGLPNDKVGGSCFVFECYEGDTLGRAGPLPKQYEPGNSHDLVVTQRRQLGSRHDVHLVQLGPIE